MDVTSASFENTRRTLTEYASESYFENKEILYIIALITLLILDKDKKRTHFLFDPFIRFMKVFVLIYISVHVLFMYIQQTYSINGGFDVNLKHTFKWLTYQSPYEYQFDESFRVLENTIRMYICVLIITQFLQIVKDKWKLSDVIIQFFVFSFINIMVVGLFLISLLYIDTSTVICILPLLITTSVLSMDRFIKIIDVKTKLKVNRKTHKSFVNTFKDIIYNIKCKNNSYIMFMNNNFVMTLTSMLFLFNICFQLYNK